MHKSELVAIRDFQPEDKNFILATWLRGLKYGNSFFNLIDPEVYFKFYNGILDQLLTHAGTTVKITCLKDDPEVILGYLVHRGAKVDWVFVKKAWRGIGIAKAMMPEKVEYISHLTDVGKSIWTKKYPTAKLNPFF